MAKKFYTDIDLNGNKLQNATIEGAEPGDVLKIDSNGKVIAGASPSSCGMNVISDLSQADLRIGDEDENALVEFKDGHIRTKYFDSRNMIIYTEIKNV